MFKKQNCTTCRSKNRPVFLFKECHICRTQWKAFYAGRTQISPMMRAIEAEKSEKYHASSR